MSRTTTNLRSRSRIFVSFTAADRELAEYLAVGLRRNLDDFDSVYCFTKPGRHNSKAGSRPTDDFIRLIDDRLNSSNLFLLLWSRHAREANGVRYELRQAKYLLMHQAKRLGIEFKILPIRIDECGLPLSLKSTVYIKYSSGENQQNTLNQILEFLDCPTENDHPSILAVKQAIFELRTAFKHKDWQAVIQQYLNVFGLYPEAVSATYHYMFAISLIKLGQASESLSKMREGILLVHQEQDADLLYGYAQCLKEKWLWNDVCFLAEKAKSIFPNDIRWQQLLLEGFSKSNSASQAFPNIQGQLLSSSGQATTSSPNLYNQFSAQPNQLTNAFNLQSYTPFNDSQIIAPNVNGNSRPQSNTQNRLFPNIQQTPSIPHLGTNDPTISSEFKSFMPDLRTEPMQRTQENLSTTQEEYSTKDSSSETEDGSRSQVRYFIEHHLSYRKVRKLVTISMAGATFLNSICFLMLSLIWPVTTDFMGIGVVVTFLVLCIGRTSTDSFVKLICVLSLCILWWSSGNCVGYIVDDKLGLKSISLGNWVGDVCTLIIIIFCAFVHIKLFYGKV